MWDSKMMSSYQPTFLVKTSFNQSFKFTVCMHAEIRNLCDSLIPRCVRIIFLQKFWEVKKFGVLRLVKKKFEQGSAERKYIENLHSLYKDKPPFNHNSVVLPAVHAWGKPQCISIYYVLKTYII